MALVYRRRHGEHVRSVILDSIAPMANKITLYYARDSQRAMDVLIDDCVADPDCHAAYPRWREVFEGLLAGLEESPAQVRMAHPRTGEPVNVDFSKDYLAAQQRNFLYTREHQSLVPYLLDQAAAGNYEPFAATADEFYAGVVDMMYLGMTFSVLCAGDVERITDEEDRELTRGTFLGSLAIDSWRSVCDAWPHAAPPAEDEPRRFDVPALLLSGRLDPVTRSKSRGTGIACRLSVPTARPC